MRYAVTVIRTTKSENFSSAVSWQFTDVEPYDGDLPSQTINLDRCCGCGEDDSDPRRDFLSFRFPPVATFPTGM